MAIELAEDIYRHTKKFPTNETYELKAQMCRAVISISANIAEGSGRNSNKEFLRFLNIATGSCHELETQAILCEKLNFITPEDFLYLNQKITELQKMLYSFKQTIKSRIEKTEIRK